MIAKGVVNIIPIHIDPKDKILIIAPHPDDECIGPGGVLCTYFSQCDVIVLTDGAQGQGNLPADECRRIRKKEFMDEMEVLGIKKYRMEGIADGTLMHHTDCLEQYDLSQYSKIFVTGTGDHHADHTAAYVSLVQALKYSQADGTEIYLYEVHNPMEQPTHYFDITECVETKCNVKVMCFRNIGHSLERFRMINMRGLPRSTGHCRTGCLAVIWRYIPKRRQKIFWTVKQWN